MKTVLILLLSCMFALPAVAQTEEPVVDENECPVLVQDALELTKDRCETIGNNEVCYGHSDLEAAARPGFPDFKFDAPGDIEDVIEMQSLSLSPMDTVRQIWGVLLMNVQAQVEETQGNVTFVVFGDAELAAPATFIEATVNANANLRALPDAASQIVGVFAPGQTFIVNGRTEDGEWLRVRFINDQGGVQLGWMASGLIETAEDLTELEEVLPEALTDESPLQYGPMQAFYFRSGMDDAPCEAAPNSGVMIQTPEGQASVTLWIDEVIIELDGTTYLQAEADGDLVAYSLDGTVSLTADGETRTAVEGTQITVPLNDTLGAAGSPTEPEAYDVDDVQSLPTDLLPETIEIAEPLAAGEGVPASGNWQFTWNETSKTCPDGSVWTFENGAPAPLSITPDGEAVNFGGGVYNRSAVGVYGRSYVDDEGNLHQVTMNVSAIDRIAGESIIDLAVTPCTLTVPFTMQLIAG
jgi:hypothetical protein